MGRDRQKSPPEPPRHAAVLGPLFRRPPLITPEIFATLLHLSNFIVFICCSLYIFSKKKHIPQKHPEGPESYQQTRCCAAPVKMATLTQTFEDTQNGTIRLASIQSESEPSEEATTQTSPSNPHDGVPQLGRGMDKLTYLKLMSAGFSFFVAGVNDGSIGALLPYVIREFHISTAIVSSV
jgi:hypothetical protein